VIDSFEDVELSEFEPDDDDDDREDEILNDDDNLTGDEVGESGRVPFTARGGAAENGAGEGRRR
jgi:hypothetical protein